MTEYVPPLRDIRFALDQASGLDQLLTLEEFNHVDSETVYMVLDEIGRFMAEVVAPTNTDGDTIGSVWNDGEVTTPDSFKAAYNQYVDTGFGSIAFDPTYGGGGFPWAVGIAIQEMMTSANMAFSLCALLTQGAIDAIEHHGSDDQKALYLPKMLTGEWAGTMNLSEPQAGSDVGAVATKAEPVGDGSFRISRTEDLDHVRRARHDREHHPPCPGPHAGGAPRNQGHHDVRGTQVHHPARWVPG